MKKATDTQEVIGTMTGARGIQFVFAMKTGGNKSVTFDFYGNGSQFNGATYARMESAALRAMTSAGYADGIESFTHWIIPGH